MWLSIIAHNKLLQVSIACVDLNDRALRKIEIGLSSEKGMKSREDSFDISVASEIMAIFCLVIVLMGLKKHGF